MGQTVVCSLGTNIMNKVDSTTQRGKLGKPKTFYFILLSTGNRLEICGRLPLALCGLHKSLLFQVSRHLKVIMGEDEKNFPSS